MSDISGSLLPESIDVDEVKDFLVGLGWFDGIGYGLRKYSTLDDFVIDSIFTERFKTLNRELLDDLRDFERDEVLNYVMNLLRNASPEKLLELLREGVEYTVRRSEKRTFKLIDFRNIDNNSFIFGWEIKFPGSTGYIKPDFTLFVNGIPLAIIEVKRSLEIGSYEEAVRQIRRYEEDAPELFRYCQFGIAYGDRKLFTPTYPNYRHESRYIHPQPWKVEDIVDGKMVKREDICYLLRHDVFLKIIRWYTFYREKDGELDKIMCRYNQYSACEKAIRRIASYLNDEEVINRGLVWHWQGSGKTYTMFYIANRFFMEFWRHDPLVFFVVDRRDLQRQLREFIEGLKARQFKSYIKVIENIEELKREIENIKRSEYRRNIVTRKVYIVLIQKFKVREFEDLLISLGEEYLEYLKESDEAKYNKIIAELEELDSHQKRKRLIELGGIQKKEILLLIDEAHRSQYGLLASVMKNVFPNAFRIAFTGTPVFKFERNTFREFANPPSEYYMDVYFIRDSIGDGFTLPIVYDVIQEGRPDIDGIKILMDDKDIKDYIDSWIEASKDGSPADEIEDALEDTSSMPPGRLAITKAEIRNKLNKVRVFLTNERRLEKLARHIVMRIEEDTENFRFKAMVVAANREACVYMKRFLDKELIRRYGEKARDWTEIVMSYQHNDRGKILEYKEELVRRWGKNDLNEINMEIQIKFKEEENPKVLIVTDMLITGFDAPILKVMYLDKPLYEHRLLQAIARVNRPYKDDAVEKKYGLIVDSVGLLRHVKDSLRKFQLIAEENIAKDVEENVLANIEQRVQEFIENLGNVKEHLKTLSLEGTSLNIDIERIKMEMKRDRQAAMDMLKNDVNSKLQRIALHWDKPEVQILLMKLREVITQFRALGSHREKMHYREDINILSYIYGRILYYIRGVKVPDEFWDGLIELIHDKTMVEDFQSLVRTKINNELMERVLKNVRRKLTAREIINESEVAEAYRILKVLLELDMANPLYRVIKERIERAREAWISRNIDATEFLEIVREAMEEKLKYDREILGKPLEDRIVETVNLMIKTTLNNPELELRLSNLHRKIRDVSTAPRITPRHEKEIRTALLKDLFIELKAVYGNISNVRKEVTTLAESLTREYIIPEIRKLMMNRGEAS